MNQPVIKNTKANSKKGSKQLKIQDSIQDQTSHSCSSIGNEEVTLKNKRKWDGKNYCIHCEKLIANFSKHMK